MGALRAVLAPLRAVLDPQRSPPSAEVTTARACGSRSNAVSASAQPQPRAGELHEPEKVASGLVVPSGHRTESLETVEKDFHTIAPPVQVSVEPTAAALARRIAGDDDLHASLANGTSERVRIVAAVAGQCAPLGVREQLLGGDHFVALPLRERDVERSRLGVDDDVELGRESSSTTTQSVAFDPPFPPDASWCARMTEASTIEPLRSTRICSAFRTLDHTPRRDQLENRL